jgi:cobalamin biosynthesis Mg chelatase CobN
MKKTVYFLSALILVSCGARKVEKSETEVKTEVTTTVKDTSSKVSETKKREQLFSFTDELEITPIDTTKSIEVVDSNGNKQTYFNAKIKRKQTQVNKSVDTEKKVAENASKVGETKAKQTVKQQTKETEKTPVSFWNYLWIVLLLLLIVGIYRFYKKYVQQREN